MKQTIKLIGGILAMVVGTVGVVLSLFLIIQIRDTSRKLEREIPQSLGHAVRISQSVRQQGEATTKILQTTRERVVYLGSTIENLSTKLNTRDKTSSLLLVIDEDIDQQLNNAKQFVLSMQNSMRNLGSTLLLFDSMSIFGTPDFSELNEDAIRQESPVRSVALGLTQTADLLDQVTLAIAKLQAGQSISPRQLINIQSTLEQVDLELVRIKSEVKNFSEEVAKTERKFAKFKQEAPDWVRYLSTIASLLLFCFGTSQFLLGLHGLRLVREARASWGSRSKQNNNSS